MRLQDVKYLTRRIVETFDRGAPHRQHCFGRPAADVRRADEVGEQQELAICRGFFVEDVERGAGEFPVDERALDRRLVHDAAAGGVDQKGGRLHSRERSCVDETARRRVQRNVQCDDVGLGEQCVERNRADVVFAVEVVVRADVVGDHGRAKRPAQPRHDLPHVSAPDDSHDRR